MNKPLSYVEHPKRLYTSPCAYAAQVYKLLALCLSLASIFGLAGIHTVQADTVRNSLLSEVEGLYTQAQKDDAEVLSPGQFSSGNSAYNKAKSRFEKGQSLDKIRRDADRAEDYFRQAIENAKKAKVVLANAYEARQDALEADVQNFAAEEWRSAEKELVSAAKRLESGNEKRALSTAAKAEAIYRRAELDAIKKNYLSETQTLVAQLEEEKVERFAPKTMALAKDLLQKAETQFDNNRYDTDEPRALAKEAKYQALHAKYIASLSEQEKEDQITVEDIVLTHERAVKTLADQLDLVARFDRGLAPTVQVISRELSALQQDAAELVDRRREITAMEEEIANLGTEVASLQGKVGTQSKYLAAQEARRAKFSRLESNLAKNQIDVIKKGDDIIIRPRTFNFAPGSVDVNADHFGIMKTILDELETFNDYLVIVEGHTDSFGANDSNLDLSMKRAQSVREFLVTNMRSGNRQDISAIGYGEAQPIANNETKEGRAKNRRIDFVLVPKK